MIQAIRSQIWRIAAVYFLIAGIVAWQWTFVWTSILANFYLNGLIIAVFIFGSFQLLGTVLGLRNEQTAFMALQEVWNDIERTRTDPDIDPLWRHERCFEPSRVYPRPQLLGHIFDLALEELHKSRRMRISIATMQNLVHAIDGRIALRRSLIAYLSGLCIFLGLIGTFIGLMKMVGSVGAIVGNAAAGGGSDPAAAVKDLMLSLQVPLSGMALGFSASLFGLFCSLVLGLIGKFVNQAMGAIRDEFEAWLASISDIESQGEAAGGRPGVGGLPAGQLGGLAVSLMSGLRRANESFEAAAESVRQLGRQQAHQGELLGKAVVQLERFAGQEREIRDALARTDAIWTELGRTREDLVRVEQAVRGGIADGFGAVARKIDDDNAAAMTVLVRLSGQQEEILRRAADLETGAAEHSGRLLGAVESLRHEHGEALRLAEERSLHLRATMAEIERTAREGAGRSAAAETAALARLEEMSALVSRSSETGAAVQALIEYALRQPDAIAAAMRPALAEGFGGISRSLDDTTRTFREGLDLLAAQQQQLGATLDATGPARVLAQELRQVAQSIETGMATGFTDLSRAVEGIFVSYAELARRAGGTGAEVAAASSAAVAAAADHAALTPPGPEPDDEMVSRLRSLAAARRPVPRRHI